MYEPIPRRSWITAATYIWRRPSNRWCPSRYPAWVPWATREQCEGDHRLRSGRYRGAGTGRGAVPPLPQQGQEGGHPPPALGCFVWGGWGRGTNPLSVNPVIGAELEEKYYVAPPLRKKKVLVVGGGPAGMEAAITAARRDMRYCCTRRRMRLGGAEIAEAVPFKQDLYRFTQCLIRRVESSGVKVTLNQRVDRALAEKVRPDVLIIAAGAQPVIPAIPGLRRIRWCRWPRPRRTRTLWENGGDSGRRFSGLRNRYSPGHEGETGHHRRHAGYVKQPM